ncbi:histidine kinase [Pelagicoccus sp. NFK12]|uniref:Histidine kinase n=1 Tax=Pelagicoccus enzymogenes TaxID=2773457 RepID=A0A927IDM5_9BACT|nr:histidine kinase [Pelagicoccus enzymogenes]MBD5778137.1 histidine kinase [Pelagicoccus enzymogenes]
MPLLSKNCLLPLIAIIVAGCKLATATASYSIERVAIFDVSEESSQTGLSPFKELEVSNPNLIWESLGKNVPQRFEIQATLRHHKQDLVSHTLSLHFPSTYEVYFDETLIGKNGQLSSTGQEEAVGRSIKTFNLPVKASIEDTHSLRIRGSHTHAPNTGHALILGVTPLEDNLHFARSTAIAYSFYIVFALFGIYLLAYFFINRTQHQYLLLGCTCVLFGIFAVNKLIYYQINVPYTYLDYIGYVANTCTFLLSIIAPATLLYTLGYRQKLIYSLAALPYILSKSIEPLGPIPATAYVCLALSVISIALQKRYAIFATSISTILLLTYELPFLAQNQALGFGALMLIFLVSIINLLVKEYKERHQAQLQNTRLQLELLKSKIQPHFVLNSLTSAIEWIETNPKQGVKLIQELAKEFDLLSSISEQKLIPLATEIESCKTYLRIMEYRKKAKYQLELINVDLSAELPPSLIRNLLENAISHNGFGEASVTFELSQHQKDGQRILRFAAPTARETSEPKTNEDGTGIRYIKARLAESYKTWSFHHGPENGKWVSAIITPSKQGTAAAIDLNLTSSKP